MSKETNALEKEYSILRGKLVNALKKEYLSSKEKLKNVLEGQGEYLMDIDPSLMEDIPELSTKFSFNEQVLLFEKELIIQALKNNEQSIGKTAHALGLSYQNLNRKIKRFSVSLDR